MTLLQLGAKAAVTQQAGRQEQRYRRAAPPLSVTASTGSISIDSSPLPDCLSALDADGEEVVVEPGMVVLSGRSSLYVGGKVGWLGRAAEVCRGISARLLLVLVYVTPSSSGS